MVYFFHRQREESRHIMKKLRIKTRKDAHHHLASQQQQHHHHHYYLLMMMMMMVMRLLYYPCYMLYIYISICCYMRGTRFHLQSIIVLIIILRVSYITYLVHIHDRWIMATSFSAFHHLPRPTAGIIYAEI